MALSLGSRFLASATKRTGSPSGSLKQSLTQRYQKSKATLPSFLNKQQVRTVYSINKITLLGHAGGEPQTHTFQDGTSVTSFSLAVSENYTRLSTNVPCGRYSKRTGEKIDRTDWFRVTVHHDRLQELVKTMVQKGSRVYVEGSLKPRKWTDNTGAERTSVEVIVRAKGEVVVVSKAADGSDPHQSHSDHESL